MDADEILDKHLEQKDVTLSELNQMRGAMSIILTDTKKIITNPAIEQAVKNERMTEQLDRALMLIHRGEA